MSRLAPNKRVDHAIRCVAELRNQGRNARLTIVGDGIVAGPLKALVLELGVHDLVQFMGYQSEATKLDLLRQSHLLVHPSVREGWGLNVIEANAMGTPAVVYPVHGLVDSTVHEVTGVVAAAERPSSLADAVMWATADEARYRRMREAAWGRAGGFRWSRVTPQVCEFLESQGSAQKMV